MAKATQKKNTDKPDAKAAPALKEGGIKVTTKRDGFRRAGIAHVGTKIYAAGELSEDQIAMLEAEPMLVVEHIAAAKPSKPEKQPEDDDSVKTPEDAASSNGDDDTGETGDDTETQDA